MSKSVVSKRCVVARSSRGSSMIEGLESRCLLSAAPLVHLAAVAPTKIIAGNNGSETVTIRNPTAAPLTETVDITLAPSVDGVTPAGTYGAGTFSDSLTLKKHGSAKVKISFTTPTNITGGKYHTLATVDLGGNTVTASTTGTYTLIVPPAPTTTPTLVGHYSGLIKQSGGGITHEATFIWMTTSQTEGSLTGNFSVGSQSTVGTMTGSENTNGGITYTLTSADINYTIVGTVAPDGSSVTGKFKGVLVNNIFKKLSGKFTITLQPS